MYSEFNNIQIAGLSAVLPEHETDNMSFAELFGEEAVRKQIKVTGIKRRRTTIGQQDALDLMLHAAEAVLTHTGWSPDSIDVLVLATGYTRSKIPSTVYLAQKHLGIKEDCIVLDLNLACTGTVDGMLTVASLLQQCGANARGLLLVGETPTIGGAGSDKSTSMLSSDCGAAVAMQLSPGSEPIRFSQRTDGSRYEVLVRKNIEDFIHMDGMEVFQFAITDVVHTISDFLEYFSIDKQSLDYIVIHQAQKFIVDKVAMFAGFDKEQVINSYRQYGNSGGASDLCTLCENLGSSEEEDREVSVFMTGFGAGLSWAMVTLMIQTENILPVRFTDQHYEI